MRFFVCLLVTEIFVKFCSTWVVMLKFGVRIIDSFIKWKKFRKYKLNVVNFLGEHVFSNT